MLAASALILLFAPAIFLGTAFLWFLAITSVVFGSLVLLPDWITLRRPKWRNTFALFLALGAAYAGSFSLDMLLRSSLGILQIQNALMPIFVWTAFAVYLHYLATMVATGPSPVRWACFLVGGVAFLGGVLGPTHSLWVALALFFIALAFLISPQAAWVKEDSNHGPVQRSWVRAGLQTIAAVIILIPTLAASEWAFSRANWFLGVLAFVLGLFSSGYMLRRSGGLSMGGLGEKEG